MFLNDKYTEMLSLVVQLALSQKQLKAANEQISDLKERLMTIRESHDDIKEDFDKVSKEVKRRRCPRCGHPRDEGFKDCVDFLRTL